MGKSIFILEHHTSTSRPAEESDTRGYPAATTAAVVDVAEPKDTGRVYPIATPPKQFNAQQSNYYNALCGTTIFTGDARAEQSTPVTLSSANRFQAS